MKLLVDANHSRRTTEFLQSIGHDAIHCTDRLPPSADDGEVVRLALSEGRTIITSDHDFGRIVALSGRSGPSVLTFSMNTYSPEVVQSRLELALPLVESDVLRGALVMITETRVRVRPLPAGHR